jgi:ATP-dependent DNA helicase PIF1
MQDPGNTDVMGQAASTGLMGGVSVILAGDFRQTLPIIDRGTPADEIDACLKQSRLWRQVRKYKLSLNMRALTTGDSSLQEFSDVLLQVGNGQVPRDSDGLISLPDGLSNPVASRDELMQKVYPSLRDKCRMDDAYFDWLCERATLAPRNDGVNDLNMAILDTLPGNAIEFKSYDKTLEEDNEVNFPVEFLNSQDLPGIPQHIIRVKIGAPVILLRNLDAPKLCNGTRLCVTAIKRNLIEAVVLTGCAKNTKVLIPRIPVITDDNPFPFKRTQFPIRLAFAMTINKSQGQSMKVVGINLETSCFAHGQLYVACSRVGSANSSSVFVPDGKTKNIVYPQVLDT